LLLKVENGWDLKTMEMTSVFIDFSYGGVGQGLRAQRALHNISINKYRQFFAGAKGGDAWR
jgi:hypothetical protein